MIKFLNFKFALLALVFGLMLVLLRISIVNFNLDEVYANLLSPFFVIPFIYFLMVSFSIKQHHWRNALLLVFGIILINIIVHYGEYDALFISKIIGLITSMLFISITFFNRINRWFIG